MIVERNIQHHRVRVECSEASSRRAASVLNVFEGLADSGTLLQPGTQIRFGWSLLNLVEDGSGLRVTEPDFALWPEPHWKSTIDTTLDILAAQTSLLHHLDVDGEDAFFDQVIIASPGALTQPKIFLRHASRVSAEDSGWLLGTLDDPEALNRDNSLETVLIASLVVRRPALLQALVLPSGFVVLFSGDSLEQIFDSAGSVRWIEPVVRQQQRTDHGFQKAKKPCSN